MSSTLSKVNACLGLSILLAPGCASIKSDMVTRDESNQCWEVRHLTGVPVTVRLVTHLRVEIIESHYLKSDGTPVASVVGREVKHTPISTPKIFTVDFKRPAAGYLKYNATFTDEQSLKSINSEIQDRTISESSLALQKILTLFPASSGKSKSSDGVADFIEVKSVVAVGLFEIDDPMFEQNIQVFLQRHLECAHEPPIMMQPEETAQPVGQPN